MAALVALATCCVPAGASLAGGSRPPGGRLRGPGHARRHRPWTRRSPPVVAGPAPPDLPGHGFKLIKVKSERVMAGQSVGLRPGRRLRRLETS